MARLPTAAETALLDALEPEAKAAWEEGLLGLNEAVQASRAITSQRLATAQEAATQANADAQTIKLKELATDNPTVYATIGSGIRDRSNPDEVEP